MSDVPVIVRRDDDGEPISVMDSMAEVLEDVRRQGVDLLTRNPKPPSPKRYRPKGRPTRLHQALIEEVCDRIRQGEHQETAALAVGIKKSTYFSWKAKGDEARIGAENGIPVPPGKAIYVQFLDAVDEARALAESRVVQAVQRAAIGGDISSLREWEDDAGNLHREVSFTRPNVAAMTWWLEKAFPQRYARRVEVSGPGGEAIPVEVEVSARDLLRKKLGESAERLHVVPDPVEEAS